MSLAGLTSKHGAGMLLHLETALAASAQAWHVWGYNTHYLYNCCSPPELILGANKYGPEIDVWSAGGPAMCLQMTQVQPTGVDITSWLWTQLHLNTMHPLM
jgi:hypothetical protein